MPKKKSKLTNEQLRLVHIAAREAGILSKNSNGRYLLLLNQYITSERKPVQSTTELNNRQLDDFLAICESLGFRMPGKAANYFRFKVAAESEYASFAQQSAIGHLAGDLGWGDEQLAGMLKRMTGGIASNTAALTPGQAYKVIEALKAMLGRKKNKSYSNLNEIKEDMETVTDGKQKTNQVE